MISSRLIALTVVSTRNICITNLLIKFPFLFR